MSLLFVRWLKITLVVIVGFGFTAMIVYAFLNSDEIRNSQIEPPLIAAPVEPIKRRPDSPGGMEIPNRDKMVFDLLDAEATPSASVADVATMAGDEPKPTAAASPMATVVQDVSGGVVSGTATLASPSLMVEKSAAMAVSLSAVTVRMAVDKLAAVSPAAGGDVVAEHQGAAPLPTETLKPIGVAKVVVSPTVMTKKTEEKAAKPVSGWGVQLAAVGSKADGNAMIAQLSKTHSALKKLTGVVVAAPDGKRYRVQFVGAKTRTEAAAVCASLGAKQPCFAVSVR